MPSTSANSLEKRKGKSRRGVPIPLAASVSRVVQAGSANRLCFLCVHFVSKVKYAEQCGIGADAEHEGQHDYGGEAGTALDGGDSGANIVRQGFERHEGVHLATRLLEQSAASELPA